jgi:hypothetical protein
MKRVPMIAGLLVLAATATSGARAADWGTVVADTTSASLARDGAALVSSSSAMDRNDNLVMVTYWENEEDGTIIRCIDVIDEHMKSRMAECRAPAD